MRLIFQLGVEVLPLSRVLSGERSGVLPDDLALLISFFFKDFLYETIEKGVHAS